MIQFLEKVQGAWNPLMEKILGVICKPLFKDILLQNRLIKDKLKKLAIMLCVTNNGK